MLGISTITGDTGGEIGDGDGNGKVNDTSKLDNPTMKLDRLTRREG